MGSEEQERDARAASVPLAPPPHPELSHGPVRARPAAHLAALAPGPGTAAVLAPVAEPAAPGGQPLEVQVVLKNTSKTISRRNNNNNDDDGSNSESGGGFRPVFLRLCPAEPWDSAEITQWLHET